MDIDATLLVTRVPEGETHGNHFRAPSFGIKDLRLTAAGKSSKLHLPEGAPKPDGARTGSDDFNFLPEHDVCELIYDLDNPFDIVENAKLEVFKRFKKEPLWTLDLAKLGPTWLRHGKHTIKWDGRIIKGDAAIDGEIDGENTKHDLTGEAAQKEAADDAPFPDGFLTLEHPPYKLRLTLESDIVSDNPAWAWTYCHVMLEKIEIKLGPEEAIPNDGTAPTLDQDKKVRKALEDAGGVPASGANREIYLLSNLFKNSGGEFAAGSSSDFDTYKTLWGDGPRIPLIAKLTARAADGSAIDLTTAAKGAVALGRAKFLWDVTDPAEVAKATDAEPIGFIADSIQFYKGAVDATRAAKDHTYFEGDNCHVDRGGKRGPDAKPLFPPQDGYAPKDTLDAAKFPFAVTTKVTDPKKRKWAAFSHPWTAGKLKGHTGVLFRPARTAGDNYIISVQLAYDWAADGKFTIDVTDKDLKVPAKITTKTGTIEIRRRLHVSRYIRKPGVPDFLPTFPQVAEHFERAFIDLKQEIAAGDNYETTAHKSSPGGAILDYNAVCHTQLTNLGYDLYNEGVVASATEDHKSVAATFKVVTYSTFVQNVHKKHLNHPSGDMAAQAAADGLSLKDFTEGLALGPEIPRTHPEATPAIASANRRARRINETRNYLRNERYWNLQMFSVTVEEKTIDAAEWVAINMNCIAGCGTTGAAAPPGLTVMHFEYIHSGTKEYVDAGNADHDGVRGSAIDATDRARDKVLFAFWRPRVDTFAHECGHHLFLPHANRPDPSPAAIAVHDKDDTDGSGFSVCLMAYNAARHGFCGFCLLRLRGWDQGALKNDRALNKKP